ncbi:hypothetical protein ACE3MS_09890 [Paenibacillus dendritiformis]|uniref:hypothetical protein n=1 Tax=Paenibacillus dendritiformis TaxID=130049 RepID=UPI003652A215
MNVEERYVNNRGVNIHVMEANRGTKDGWPLVVIPGLAEAAEDYREVVEKLYPRHCVVIRCGDAAAAMPRQAGIR